jgi:hypothetical protein
MTFFLIKGAGKRPHFTRLLSGLAHTLNIILQELRLYSFEQSRVQAMANRGNSSILK